MIESVEPARSHWLPFTTGMAVGLVTGLLGVGLAVAAERARRRVAAPRLDYPEPPAPAARQKGFRAERAARIYPPIQERELDEELAQSFPASDPLPHPHQVD